MSLLPAISIGIAIGIFYFDLSSPNGILFGQTARDLLRQHKLFGVKPNLMQLAYQLWIGVVMTVTLTVLILGNSIVFATLLFISGIWGGLIFLQASVHRRLIGFDSEFLRFIQMLKSDYHLQSSLSSLIPATIERLRENDRKSAKQRSNLYHFLQMVQSAIASNQDHVSAFRQARSALIEGSGLQIKLMNLFIGFISSIHDSGNAGRAFDSLEKRIESDLAINSELRAVTSGAKLQMVILALVPPAVMILFSFMMSEMVSEMFQSTFGQALVSVAALMTLTAVWLTQKILNVKI